LIDIANRRPLPSLPMSLAFPAPPAPVVPTEQSNWATWEPRYDEVTQDGRLTVFALLPAIGLTVWRPMLTRMPGLVEASRQGIVPILSRLTVAAEPSPIRVDRSLSGHGRFAMARRERTPVSTTPGAPEVDRLYLNAWADVEGIAGRMVPPLPEGGPVAAGRVFSSHVFTRPFAPHDQRRVTRLDFEGVPPVPETLFEPPPLATACEAPIGTTWLDDEITPDSGWTVLGLDHTDSNQHVSSLVQIRMVIDAAHQRLAAHGHRGNLLVRAIDLGFRKPCFSGERIKAVVRAFACGTESHRHTIGAAGVVISESDSDAKPRTYARVLME